MIAASACPANFYFSLPAAILTCWIDPQTPRAFPVRWWGMVCGEPSQLSLAIASRLIDRETISSLNTFGLSLVGKTFSQTSTFQRSMVEQNFDLLLASSADWYVGSQTGVPLLKGTCFQAECREARMTTCVDTLIIQGVATALHVKERVYGPTPPVNLCNLPQFEGFEQELSEPNFAFSVDCEGLS